MKLKNREEKIIINNNTYELGLYWDFEAIEKSSFSISPFMAYIRKNGRNYAYINCDSNCESFSISEFCDLFDKPKWVIKFPNKNICDIPFKDILKNIPI